MTGSTKRRAVLAVSIACAALPRAAAAQNAEPLPAPTPAPPPIAPSGPDAPDTEEARALYVEGKELRRKGELERSREKFLAAYAIHPTAITALEVGRSHALMGRLREALDVLDGIERIAVKPTDSDKAAAARVEARELAAQLRRRIPTLRIAIDGAGSPGSPGAPPVRVRVDGEAIPTDALEQPWKVDPGAHHVEAAGAQGTAEADLRVEEGEERVVRLRLTASGPTTPAAPSTSGAGSTTPTSPPTGGWSTARWVAVYSGFGVAGAGLVLGATTGILTLARASDLKPRCVDGVCPRDAGLDAAQSLGNLSTISFVVAGVGTVVGVAALLLGIDRPADVHRAAWIRPALSGGVAGLEGGF